MITGHERYLMVRAFEAGWEGRKQAEYNLLKKDVDKRPAIPDTLFPTTGELP